MEIRDEFGYEKSWDELSPDARTISVYMSHLEPKTTHSDPETLESFMGMERPQLDKALNELRTKGLLTHITLRQELEKVAAGGTTDIADGPMTWTPEQAKNILKNAPDRSTLDWPHYRLVPGFKEHVQNKFWTAPEQITVDLAKKAS